MVQFDTTIEGDAGADASLGRIDKYELRRELGEGGFGTVYLAHDTVADVDVAVKGLPPEVKHNAAELESIRGNFALMKRLRHPNIVAVTDLHQAVAVRYASKEVESKLRVYERDTMVVMDYAPGVTLAQWHRRFPDGKVPLDKAIAVVRQIASALDYAHGQKVLHRDVKPANVMVETSDGGKLVARVLDFGLAAEIRSSMGRLSREIRDTSGTRPYMAPEQWKGERQGPATDQYALAAMFYELVVGEVPFASVFDCGDPAVMRIAVTTDAPSVPADLPKCVRRALAVALAKKPEERFASCGEFAAALEGKRVSRRGAETQGKSGAGKVIAALAFLAAIGVGGLVYRQNQVRRRADLARQEAASAAAAKADAERKAEAARRTEEARKLEDERRKLEEERRAVEAEKERIEKERVRKEQQHGSELSDESLASQEARRKEVAELAEIRFDIAIEGGVIADTMAKIEPYRNEPDGFASHIANADAQRKIADGVGRSPATSVEAKAALKTLEDVERVIQREYNWLKTNKTDRDEARQIESEIVRDIVPGLERFKAGDYARVAYSKGDRLRKDGNTALQKGDFPAAKAKLSEAKKQLSAAAAEAKGFCIDTHLKTAKKWIAASKWQKCVEECDTILGWDAANAEAKRLKTEAENHLVPSEKVVVKQDGTEINHGNVKTLTLPGGATMEMIYVEPGTFTMGSPSSEEGRYGDETQHRVTLTKGFWLGKYEVTQKQWQSVMGANPSYFKGDNLPVEKVSWNDCQEFARKVNDAARRQFGGGARLPTEAEWEYACRAGTSDAYSGTGRLDDMGWYSHNSGSKTHTVGQKRANGWGFHDMHGNVFEWCQDWHGDYGGNSTDPSGPASGGYRVLRGGGWIHYARNCRSAIRFRDSPGFRNDTNGFRLCCSALP